MRNRSALLSAALLGLCALAWAQGGGSTMPDPQPMAGTGPSRAEVLADLVLWHRAGLSHWPLPSSEIDPRIIGDYQAALTRYRELHAGPAYQEAVARYRAMLGK